MEWYEFYVNSNPVLEALLDHLGLQVWRRDYYDGGTEYKVLPKGEKP